tara:strand:+ start:31909 stop:33708 length:1800 start_codon:yes stop_codon:yes gene_type:complete
MTNTPKYKLVSSFAELRKVVTRCKKMGPTALDFETTSLDAGSGRVRLVSLCNTKISILVDFDRIKGGFKKCARLFEGGQWIVFYSGFEGRWFQAAGSDPELLDVGYLRRAILGGGRFKLMQIALWDLDVEMDKTEQAGNWAAKRLTQEQLDYAYFDADVTWRLWEYWSEQSDPGRWDAFHLLNDMVPAVIEMEDAGILLDRSAHQVLVDHWGEIKKKKYKAIRRMVKAADVNNIDSASQWSDYFARYLPDHVLAGWPKTEKTGQLSMKNDTLKNLAGTFTGTPLEKIFDLLADYKTISKYLSSFGQSLITSALLSPDKRIRARFNIGAAKTCRFSSSGPNLQQMPRDRELLGEATSVRSSFTAGLGRSLVSLDYSGIELRTLALLSGDQQLLIDCIEGDVHAEVGSYMVGKAITKATKAGKIARQAAKPVSFLIIYGGGAPGLSYATRISIEKAQGLIDFWSDRYEKAFQFRYDQLEEAERTRYLRMADGGTIYMGKNPELPKCANFGVQRTALSIMAKAIVRHKNSLDDARGNGRQKMTRMIATIHDALIDEAAKRDARNCLKLMEHDMTQGYLDVFPGAPIERLVEGGIGPNWAELD